MIPEKGVDKKLPILDYINISKQLEEKMYPIEYDKKYHNCGQKCFVISSEYKGPDRTFIVL